MTDRVIPSPFDIPEGAKPIKMSEGTRTRRERAIQRTGVKHAKRHGWKAAKVSFSGLKGYPDFLFIGPNGLSLWWEFKKLGQKPDPIQEVRMEELRSNGHNVGWSDNYEDFKRAFDALREWCC